MAKFKKSRFTTIQKTILFIIASTFALVIVALICSFALKPENLVKSTIASRSADYYENYFYEDFVNSAKFAKINNIEKAFSKYSERGFSKVRLSEILFHGGTETTDDISRVLNYCDEDESFVQFFPETPYEKNTYHIDYNLSCNF